MTQNLTWQNAEPSIAELLSDPIAHLLMARDGVRVRDVVAIVERARHERGSSALLGHSEAERLANSAA